MQSVSYEWRKNQLSNTQKQGFCEIEITTRYSTSAANTKTLSSLTPGNDIKELRHKRTFDPMCISLPSNTLSVTLYNYNAQYDEWYKTYADYTTRIVLRYGFVLSTQETIIGGTFIVSSIVMNRDNTITVEAGSSLDIADDADVISGGTADIDATKTVYENSDTSQHITELKFDDFAVHNFESFTSAEIISKAAAAYRIVIKDTAGIGEKDVTLPFEWEFDSTKALMYALNYIQGNAKISRDTISDLNVLELAPTGVLYYVSGIQSLNIMEYPEYEMTSKVRNVQVTAPQFSESIETSQHDYESATSRILNIGFDYTKYELLSVKLSTRYSSAHIALIQRGVFYYGRGYHFETQRSTTQTYDATITITYKELLSKETTTKTYNADGSICDISNDIAKPSNAERFANYFSNRDLYTLTMRADPARDVGDYVFAELEPGVFSKVLILESELTFDGSFSEKTLVRKITTDFETVTVDNATPTSYFTISNGQATKYTGTATNVTVPLSVTSLGAELFKENSALCSCTMAPIITSVGTSCFYGCANLKTTIIPDSVTTMGAHIFEECLALTDVVLSQNMKEIPSAAFFGCSALTDVILPDKAETLGGYAFWNCMSLKSVKLPTGLTSIGEFCFAFSGLTEIFIPAGIGYIRNGCFSHCEALTKVSMSPNTRRIGVEAFLSCNKLEEISLENVSTIEDDAFKDCSGLKRVVMPQSTRYVVSEKAFGDNIYTEGGFNGVLVIKRGSSLVSYAESNGFKYEIID